MADVLLSLRLVETEGRGALILRATDGVEDFQVAMYFDDRQSWFQVSRRGLAIPGARGDIGLNRSTPTIEISLIDQQFLLALDGRTLATVPYERSGVPCPTATPLAIGVQGLGVALADLRVYRDVYYTRPIGYTARWALDAPARLSDDEYFVLGDNSPISDDSRTWPGGYGVKANLLVGKPLSVTILFPSLRWFGW